MHNKKVLYSLKNSNFNVIEYSDFLENRIIALASDKVIYSSTMTGDDKYKLNNLYMRLYDVPNIINNDITNTLVLGAGCFSYPKYYISKYKDKYLDAVEVDKEIIDIAYKYFFLNDLYQEFDCLKKRLKIYIKDAYEYVKRCNNKYDYILLDIFNDDEPIDTFLSRKFTKNITRILKDKGIIAVNYIVNPGKKEKFQKYLKVLKNNFKYIYLLTINDSRIYNAGYGNIYIMCSNIKYKLDLNSKVLLLNEKYL